MNKAELIDVVASRIDASKKDASEAVQAVIDAITESVAKGQKVSISGFGVFERAERAARTYRAPSTGEAIRKAASAVPRFRPGGEFKASVSSEKPAAAAKKAAAKATAPAKKAATAATAAATKATAPAKAAAKKATAPAKAAATKATAPAKKAATSAASKAAPAAKAPAKAAAPAQEGPGRQEGSGRQEGPGRQEGARQEGSGQGCPRGSGRRGDARRGVVPARSALAPGRTTRPGARALLSRPCPPR